MDKTKLDKIYDLINERDRNCRPDSAGLCNNASCDDCKKCRYTTTMLTEIKKVCRLDGEKRWQGEVKILGGLNAPAWIECGKQKVNIEKQEGTLIWIPKRK